MNNEIDLIFKAWCKETKRNGGVLTGQSIHEWHQYLSEKMEERVKKEALNFNFFYINTKMKYLGWDFKDIYNEYKISKIK